MYTKAQTFNSCYEYIIRHRNEKHSFKKLLLNIRLKIFPNNVNQGVMPNKSRILQYQFKTVFSKEDLTWTKTPLLAFWMVVFPVVTSGGRY